MPLTIAFWNIQKKDLSERVGRILEFHGVDVMVLAECTLESSQLSAAVSKTAGSEFKVIGNRKKLTLLTNLDDRRVQSQFDSMMGDIKTVRLDVSPTPLLLVAVHLPSQLAMASGVASQHAVNVASRIAMEERKIEHANTVVIGDFNMNPYEIGLTGTLGFSAVSTKAMTRVRKFRGEQRDSFYNPMWRLLGDATPGPPGTFVFKSQGCSNNWCMPDQVLVRSPLADRIEDIKILDTDGESKLTSERSGYPNKKFGSDHLPILIRLSTS